MTTYSRRCHVCDFGIAMDEPYICTDFGFAHPVCAPDDPSPIESEAS